MAWGGGVRWPGDGRGEVAWGGRGEGAWVGGVRGPGVGGECPPTLMEVCPHSRKSAYTKFPSSQ